MSKSGIIYVSFKYRGCKNLKNCKFCNASLPDEASFCLHCSSPLNGCEKSEPKAPKRFIRKRYVEVFIVLLFIFSLSIFSAYRIKKLPTKAQTNAPETVLIPVTEENGETVTNPQGDTVFEAVTVETTTKKPTIIGVIGSLLGVDKDKENDKDNNNVSSSNTTDYSGSDIGSKPPSTETDISDFSEISSTDSGSVNEPTQNSPTTETEPPTKKEESIKENPAEVFEFAPYSSNKSYLSIAKYKGNAEHVVIPASYNGQYIVEIQRNAFKDNDKVKIISIDENRPYFDLKSECFYNCQNLHTINLPNVLLEISSNFAKYCYAMKTIVINNNRYKFENGGLYYYNSRIWYLLYCCPASFPDTFTIPLWSAGIVDACNLSELSQLRVINCHQYVSSFPHQTSLPKNLEAIYVDDKNKNGYDVNGIAFGLRNGKYYCSYPPSNPTKEFTLPNNSYLIASWLKNPYLETLRIEETAEILSSYSIADKFTFTNLKTIYIKSGHKDEADIKRKFKGTVYTY